jgi:hypothetical protein
MLRPSLPPRPDPYQHQVRIRICSLSLTRSADPVNVVLNRQRKAVVEHTNDIGYVKPTCRHVRRNEDPRYAVPKLL